MTDPSPGVAALKCSCWIGRGELGGADRHACPLHNEAVLAAKSQPNVAALDAETLEQRLRHGAYLTWDELVALATAAADALAATRQVLQPPDVAALDAEIEDRFKYCQKDGMPPPLCQGPVDEWCDTCLARAYQAATRAALQLKDEELEAVNQTLSEFEASLTARMGDLQRVEQERDIYKSSAEATAQHVRAAEQKLEHRTLTMGAAVQAAAARLAQVEAALTSHAIQCPQCQDAALATLREVTR